MGQPLSGTEWVLLAEVPMAGGRWHQVGFNLDVKDRFFRITDQSRSLTLERVAADGSILSAVRTPFVYSNINRNPRVEFEFDVEKYPDDGPPILLVLELGLRRFRYISLLPGESGYHEISVLNQALPRLGKGRKRSLTNLDTVELHWPQCPLRHAHM
jgi:hypothetical protein